MANRRESGPVSVGFRRKVQNSYKLPMTSGASLFIRDVYFSWRHLDPESEPSSEDPPGRHLCGFWPRLAATDTVPTPQHLLLMCLE